jgi:hypothetical protein
VKLIEELSERVFCFSFVGFGVLRWERGRGEVTVFKVDFLLLFLCREAGPWLRSAASARS